MDKNYTFEQFWEDLDDGFQIYYKYMDKKYLLYKVTKNCYKQELLTIEQKSPIQKNAMLTLKRVKELFPYMEELEYKV